MGTPGQVTTAGGSLWYLEATYSNPAYIGKMTTSGTTTDYDIRALSGDANLTLNSITTGPDDNVWFDAKSGSYIYTGFLDISTGTVTLYSSGYLNGSLDGKIVPGSDGRLWYAYKTAGSPAYTYLVNVNPSTGTTTIGFTLSDTYANYTDITAGPDGKLWVTDAFYNKVYKFTVSSGTAVLNGNYSIPTASSNPYGIVPGPDGNVWFVEGYTGKIAKVTPTGLFTEYAPASGVSFGGQLVAGSDGAVWLPAIVGGVKSIARITSSGTVTTYALPGSGIEATSFQGITIGPDGAAWFSYVDSGGAKLGSIVVTPDFTNHSISSGIPASQLTTAGGSLWYLGGTYNIGNMTTSGTNTNYNIRTLSGNATLTLNSITTGPDGNVWFDGVNSGGSIYAGFLNTSTGTATAYSTGLQGSLDGKIVSGSDGRLWFAYKTAGSPAYTYLVNVDPSTGTTTIGYNSMDTYASFTDLAAGPDGRLWVGDYFYNKIKAFTIHSATNATLSGYYSIPTASSNPMGIVSGPDGNVWFLEGYAGKIAKITPTGSVTEYAPASGVNFSGQLVAGSDGAVWFSATISGVKSIARITPSGTVTTYTIPGSSVSAPSGTVLGPDDAIWFSYGDSGGAKVGRLGY